MALSDSPLLKYKPRSHRRGVGRANARWSDAQKIEAVTAYLTLGSMQLAAATLKIPYETIKSWSKTEWWKETRDHLRTQEDLQVSNRMKKILDKSYSVIEDRLENGDWLYDTKTGEFKRKGVSAKDALAVAKEVAERRDTLVDRHMAEKGVSEDAVANTLKRLADSFAQMALGKPPINVTDVIEVEKKDGGL